MEEIRTISKGNARRLGTVALEMGADVVRGPLESRDEKLIIGETDLKTWLEAYKGHELILIAASISQETRQVNICRTCGQEYEGNVCPYCQEARLRLRGR
ncbi:MAG: hypothetical protein ACUVV0_02810 [Anaerolineae bacterium]